MKYKIQETWEELSKRHSGLLEYITKKISSSYGNLYGSYPDIRHMVDIAAYHAWIAWRRKGVDGFSEHSFGTYLNNHIKIQLSDKKNKLSFHFSYDGYQDEIESKIDITKQMEDSEWIKKHLDRLSSREQNVINYRYMRSMTLDETAKKMDMSIEGVRLLQNRTIGRLREMACVL